MERLVPKDLGYDFPEVPGIFIGDCGSVDEHYDYNFGRWGGAHTHMCNKDVFHRCICISDKRYIFDEIMWHEYAHALTKNSEVISMQCLGIVHELSFSGVDAMKQWRNGHNEEWRELIKKFGYPDRESIPIWEVSQ